MNTGLNEKTVLNIFSWNIEGKHHILKNQKLKNSLKSYDIMFIHETHCNREMEIKIDGYNAVQHPCLLSSNEHPRGGCIMFIKNNLQKYVEGIDKNYNDTIVVYMSFNLIICGMYVPPVNSKYFGDHFDILDVYSSAKKHVILCGDLNSRVGHLGELNGLTYSDNPDTEVNEHGKSLIEVCKSNKMIPLNMLSMDNKTFVGGYTFNRSNHKSQLDWVIASRNCLEHVVDFSR